MPPNRIFCEVELPQRSFLQIHQAKCWFHPSTDDKPCSHRQNKGISLQMTEPAKRIDIADVRALRVR